MSKKTTPKGRCPQETAALLLMNVTPTCFSKDCSKPRFLEYYVCAEHFVYYAAARYTEYTEPIAAKVEPITYSVVPVFTSEATSCSFDQSEDTARRSAQRL
jgi:hypothetical protein